MKIRVCDECGKTNPPDAWYCEACGASLSMKAIVKDSPESIQAYQDEQKAKQEILPVGLDLKQDSQHLTATFYGFRLPD